MAIDINPPSSFNYLKRPSKAMISGQYMQFACILQAELRDILRRMKNDKQQSAVDPTPKGARLEKAEVWLPVESKRRLEQAALQENRSTNKQAVHYIENGLNGPNFDALVRKIDSIEALLIEALKRMDER